MGPIDNQKALLILLSSFWPTLFQAPPDPGVPLVEKADIPPASDEWLEFAVPELMTPEAVDMDTMALLVAALHSAITGLLSGVSVETITQKRHQKQADFERAQRLEAEARAKAKEAADAAEKAKIGDWIASIAMVIGAVVGVLAAIALGANPFLLVAAVGGLLMAVQGLANTIVNNMNDGKGVMVHDALGNEVKLDLSWAGAVDAMQKRLIADGNVLRRDGDGNVIDAKGNKMTAEQVKAAQAKNPFVKIMTEEDIAKERLAATLTIEIVLAIVMIACGVRGMIGAGKGAADAASAAGRSTRLGIEASNRVWAGIGRWAEGITSVTEVLSAGGDMACAAYAGVGATAQLASSDAQAEQHYYEKKMKVVLAAMRDLEDLLKKLVKALNASYDAMSEQIKEIDESRTIVLRNIVRVN